MLHFCSAIFIEIRRRDAELCQLHQLPSAKYLETLAKILHILTYSRLLLKVLIRSCLFLLDTKLFKLRVTEL